MISLLITGKTNELEKWLNMKTKLVPSCREWFSTDYWANFDANLDVLGKCRHCALKKIVLIKIIKGSVK